MTTPADFTTRARDEMYALFNSYQALQRRVQDLQDEVTALGGFTGIYGAGGANFPAQTDGFVYADMTAAGTAILALVGAPTTAQKNAVIKCRRT